MKNVDYRKKLGLGFNDESKIKMLKTRIFNLLTEFDETKEDWELEIDIKKITRNFSDEIGILIPSEYKNLQIIYYIICSQKDISSCVYFFVTFLNTLKHEYNDYVIIETLETRFFFFFDNMKLSYDKSADSDGIFIFPKGAEELDDALVSEPLDWMKDYPSAHGAFIKALKAYAECTENNVSDVADLFRKALESFFQEFFSSEKSLENMISDYGNYLKNNGIPKEISNNFEKILNQYTEFMNNYAKHHDKTSINVLEYIMYQTGNIIRLLITLKKQETTNAN